MGKNPKVILFFGASLSLLGSCGLCEAATAPPKSGWTILQTIIGVVLVVVLAFGIMTLIRRIIDEDDK